jgi:hypothetical protein
MKNVQIILNILKIDDWQHYGRDIEIKFVPPVEEWPLNNISFSQALQILNNLNEELIQTFQGCAFDKLTMLQIRNYLLAKMRHFCNCRYFLVNIEVIYND